MGAFSGKNGRARKTRFTLADGALETADGGNIGAGIDNNTKEDYLVHADIPQRATEAIALHAVAKAIGGGAISAADVVGAYAEEDNLSALRRALAAWDVKNAPPAARKRKPRKPAPAPAAPVA